MKKLLFTLLFLFPALLFAQNTQDPSDPRYLDGAFNYNNGKMYVERKLDVAELNASQIKNVLGDWLKDRFKDENDRIIEPTDNSSAYIVQSSDKIRVKIGLFGSNVNFVYNLLIKYDNAQCTFQFRGMRFSNNPFSKSPAEFVTAEEYLTDKNSLNKDRTKVSAGIGTYRMSVIDKIDEIALEAQKFIDISFKNLVRNNEVSASAIAAAKSANTTEAKDAVETIKPAEKVENTIVSEECVKLIKAGGAAITAVGGKKLGKAVFGSAKYTKFGGTEVIMYKNAQNEDNINLLLDMSDSFEVSVFDGSRKIATFKCRKAESLDDSVVGEIVSKL